MKRDVWHALEVQTYNVLTATRNSTFKILPADRLATLDFTRKVEFVQNVISDVVFVLMELISSVRLVVKGIIFRELLVINAIVLVLDALLTQTRIVGDATKAFS